MSEINGNLDGIRKSYIERLKGIYEIEINRNQFATEEMLDLLASFTEATSREAMVYIDRSGYVLKVAVGETDRVEIPVIRKRRSKSRLSGIRCIHTHPGGNPSLSDADIQALINIRLDAMAAVGVLGGKAVSMQVGILEAVSNDKIEARLFGPYKASSIPDDLLWDEIFIADASISPADTIKSESEIAKAILVGLEGDRDAPQPFEELYQLAKTAGYITIGSVLQSRSRPDRAYYLGFGRLHDLSLEAQALNADTVIFDDELSPAQIRNIQKELGEKIDILDRTSLILDIFADRALTHEGRLQVELAQMKYLLPRMAGYWTHFSRMGGGGSGGGGGGARRGEGETQLEVDRRLLRRRLNELEKEIDKIKKQRDVNRVSRERINVPIVALVGYTNSGKSTILNYLSGSDVLVADKLFATLDPVSRKVNVGSGDFLLVDTVGFINKLSHDLVDAFRATLEEVKYADLLVLVVDSSADDRLQQIQVVNDVLSFLGADDKPILTVYNKADISGETFQSKDSLSVSALTGQGMEQLADAITQKLSEMRSVLAVLLPFDSGSLVSKIYTTGQVIDSKYQEDGIYLQALVSLEDASKLRAVALKVYS
ncbi:MAG: GTPase HflX [Eubacteriaceae bacterium]|nr:GTPase HflX [Eubacteriaceae bacterium]